MHLYLNCLIRTHITHNCIIFLEITQTINLQFRWFQVKWFSCELKIVTSPLVVVTPCFSEHVVALKIKNFFLPFIPILFHDLFSL